MGSSHIQAELPKGIHRNWLLPDPALGVMRDSIILDDRRKTQLLSQAVVNFTVRGKVDRNVLPLHGVILLVGLPGTGKTSLARGLAHRVADAYPSDPVTFQQAVALLKTLRPTPPFQAEIN
jgi:Cdc6-like AAA superfamily ATPase